MKTLITIFILIVANILPTSAQSKVDVESIFKMQLFLEKTNVEVDKFEIAKNYALYVIFKEETLMQIDTLETINIHNNFQFYSFDIDSGLSYKTPIISSDTFYFICLIHGATTKYILCVDMNRGKSYRISGFNGNDFLSFLIDYRKYHNDLGGNLSDKKFIKNSYVEGVDFKCLYKGLHAKNPNTINHRYKYPCLKRVTDPFRAH
jgi:hypothetical protein